MNSTPPTRQVSFHKRKSMIQEWLQSIRAHIDDRLSNPVLGPFAVAWVVSNWKLVLILLFSEYPMEVKIGIVESNYVNVWTMLIYPLVFAAFYALCLPWCTFWVQVKQDIVTTKRRLQKIKIDTEYLSASIGKVEAQARIEEVKTSHENRLLIEKRRQELELERDQTRHNFEVERDRRQLDYEMEDRKRHYEDERQRRKDELEHERRMRELEFDERKRKEEIELQRFKSGFISPSERERS